MECKFAVNQLSFDLCPLFNSVSAAFEVSIDEDTPPTHTKNVYVMNFNKPLAWDGTLPAELQCPEGTRICLTVINSRPNHPSEPSRILQVIPVAGEALLPKAKMGAMEEGSQHAPLQLTLHGGHYKQQHQKATFLFHCDETASEPTMPSYMWQFNGTHAFSWRSKYACHAPLTTPQPNPLPDPDPPQEPPKDPDLDRGEDVEHSSNQFHFIILLFWMVIIILLMARVMHPFLRRRYHHRGPSSSSPRRLQSIFSSRIPYQSLSWGKARLNGKFNNIYQRAYPDMEVAETEEAPLTPNAATTPTSGRYGSF